MQALDGAEEVLAPELLIGENTNVLPTTCFTWRSRSAKMRLF
jgi:hypothetical protein